MAAEKGSAFLLKVGNGATPVVYATVAGLRTTQLSVNGEAVASDWGTKDRRGREVRIAVLLRDLAERPGRLAELADKAGAAIEAMPRTLGGWRIASLAPLRSRMAGEGPGKWIAVIEYRVRILEGDD